MAAIVFDLDGTLIDSAPDLHVIANAVLAERDMAPITIAQTRDFVGNGANVFVEKMRATRDIPEADHASVLTAFLALYESAVELTQPYPGVIGALEELLRAGHQLGVCTNKPIVPTQAVLDHLELSRFFSVVLGGDSLPTHKPDPAPLHAAFEALGQENRLYVGDSDVDAETARRAKMPFLLFTEGYRKSPIAELPHNAAFDHFDQLTALVKTYTEEIA